MDIDEVVEEILPSNSVRPVEADTVTTLPHQGQRSQTKKPKKRRVSFPEDDKLVSKSVEPVDPWANGSNSTSAEVIKAYTNFCAKLRTKPIDKLVKQLKEHDAFHCRINILDLKGIKLDVKSCEALEEIFKRVQVHVLDVENTNLEDEGAIALIEMIEFYQSALHICIGYNPRIKTRGWQIFSQMVRKAQFIEFIDIRHCCFNDPCSAVMARSLRLNTTLRILHLEGDNLSGKLLLILCTGIKFNQSLSELFLGDNFLVPSDGNTLSTMLKSNTTLQLLDLRNNMLQDQGVLHLSDGLTQQKSGEGVKTLVLWNNQVTRNGMIPMANLLAVSQNIQTLNIGHNRLGNDGISSLQKGLLKNRSLLRLGLLNTKLTAEGAVALAEYIADTRTLLRLDLRENDLFVGGLMALTLAVKINETVVRIDLDKDLKKEQGMEGTQTSLLVDIYQYLERNKKLGIEREELRRQEVERENSANDVTSNEPVGDVPNDDVTVDGIPGDDVMPQDDVTVQSSEGKEGENSVDSGGLQNHVDDQSSRFVVSLVDNDATNAIKVNDEEGSKDVAGGLSIDDGLVSGKDETKAATVDETSKLLNEFDKIEEVTDPEDFDKELDELLANVSGVKIDLSDPPKTDDTEEFWNKDMNEILESTAS